MTIFKFDNNDVFVNRIKTAPKTRFFIYNGRVHLNQNNDAPQSAAGAGHADLFEMNPGRTENGFPLIYPFIHKSSALMTIQGVSVNDFNANFGYGDVLSGSYPLSASISRHYYDGSSTPLRIRAMSGALQTYGLSKHFSTDYSRTECALINLPSIFFGNRIKKGSVRMEFHVSGAVQAVLQDLNGYGELRETTGSNVGKVAGLVLYNHGMILITGSWDLNSSHTEEYRPGLAVDNPKWIYFGTTGSTDPVSDGSNVPSSSFDISFRGENFVPTLTMFCHAKAGMLNHSNNPTFFTFNQSSSLAISSSTTYREPQKRTIKNTVTSSFLGSTGSFSKQTFISSIAIYDEDMNVIAIAKPAYPVRKREIDDITFKLKLDL